MSGWAVRIPYRKDLVREDRKAIFDWLNETLGMRDMSHKAVHWRWNAVGGLSKDGHDWFCFRYKKDAMLFKLTWHEQLKVVD